MLPGLNCKQQNLAGLLCCSLPKQYMLRRHALVTQGLMLIKEAQNRFAYAVLLAGSCTTFKEALEVYMATAGTHYRKFSQVFYDVSQFETCN